LKSAGQSNNTTGLLSTTRVSQGRNRLSLTLLPQTRPRRSISSRILSAMPQCNFILITQRALGVGDSARFRSIFPWTITRTGCFRVFSALKQSPRPPQRHSPRSRSGRSPSGTMPHTVGRAGGERSLTNDSTSPLLCTTPYISKSESYSLLYSRISPG
jgi:hypothetical protein